MNVEKLLDALTPQELSEVLQGAARRFSAFQKNGHGNFPLHGDDGRMVGYIVFGEYADTESPEILAELAELENLDEPEYSAEDFSTMLERDWPDASRS